MLPVCNNILLDVHRDCFVATNVQIKVETSNTTLAVNSLLPFEPLQLKLGELSDVEVASPDDWCLLCYTFNIPNNNNTSCNLLS